MAHFTHPYQSSTAGPGAGRCHRPAGQYAYELVVNGQPVAIPQRFIIR